MWSRMVCLFLILCLAPLSSMPLVDELMQISSQFQIALDQAEKALNELEAELQTAKSLQTEQGRELGLLKREAIALSAETESLRQALSGSATQLLEAEKQLRLVETHTEDLRTSFGDYKKRAEKGIHRQKIKTWFYVLLAAAGAGAAGYGIGRMNK